MDSEVVLWTDELCNKKKKRKFEDKMEPLMTQIIPPHV